MNKYRTKVDLKQGHRGSQSGRRFLGLLCLAVAGVAAGAVPVEAQRPDGLLRVEQAYFNGAIVTFLQPSVTSSKPNQGQFACFELGPDFSEGNRAAAAPPLYIILAPGVTQDSCPDGSLQHDHVLSTAPGFRGYTGSWSLVLVLPTNTFIPAEIPFTSAAQVAAAAAAGRVVLMETTTRMVAPVIGGN